MYITTNQTYNYNMMQSFFYIFTGAYIKNGKARKKYCKEWYGKVAYLAREKLIEVTLISVLLEHFLQD